MLLASQVMGLWYQGDSDALKIQIHLFYFCKDSEGFRPFLLIPKPGSIHSPEPWGVEWLGDPQWVKQVSSRKREACFSSTVFPFVKILEQGSVGLE